MALTKILIIINTFWPMIWKMLSSVSWVILKIPNSETKHVINVHVIVNFFVYEKRKFIVTCINVQVNVCNIMNVSN